MDGNFHLKWPKNSSKLSTIAPNHNRKTVQNGTDFEKKNVLEKRTYGRTPLISREKLQDKKMYVRKDW